MARRNDIDWELIERDYRIGVLTVQMLVEKYSVDRASIHRKAKKYKWTRDLSVQVQAATKAKVNAAIIENATTMQLERNSKDEFEVDSQANINASIIRSHQKDAGASKEYMHILMNRLHDQIKDTATLSELLEQVKVNDPLAYKELFKAMSLGSHVSTLKQITELHANIVKTERTAFNIDVDAKAADPELEASIKRIRARADFKKFQEENNG